MHAWGLSHSIRTAFGPTRLCIWKVDFTLSIRNTDVHMLEYKSTDVGIHIHTCTLLGQLEVSAGST